MWVIIAPKGNIIRLNWISFDLENEGSSRCYDYVQLFDNSTNGDIGMFCGKSKPLLTMSASNMLKILFKTDFSNNFGGFELLYDFVNATNRKKITKTNKRINYIIKLINISFQFVVVVTLMVRDIFDHQDGPNPMLITKTVFIQ